jgi:hypothetical protein
MAAPDRSNPIISNNFPEYELLSRKSKILLNGVRGSIATGIISAAGLFLGANPNLLKQTPEVATTSLVGFIGSVVVGGAAALTYIHTSDRDEHRPHQNREIPPAPDQEIR